MGNNVKKHNSWETMFIKNNVYQELLTKRLINIQKSFAFSIILTSFENYLLRHDL